MTCEDYVLTKHLQNNQHFDFPDGLIKNLTNKASQSNKYNLISTKVGNGKHVEFYISIFISTSQHGELGDGFNFSYSFIDYLIFCY